MPFGMLDKGVGLGTAMSDCAGLKVPFASIKNVLGSKFVFTFENGTEVAGTVTGLSSATSGGWFVMEVSVRQIGRYAVEFIAFNNSGWSIHLLSPTRELVVKKGRLVLLD